MIFFVVSIRIILIVLFLFFSSGVTLTATRQPHNGDCVASPTSGRALFDTFTFTCDNWMANGNTTSSLEYALIYDSIRIKDYDSDNF